MVNSAVLLGGGTAQVVENDLLPFKTGLSALAQLKQDKIHRGIRLMAHKAQPLGFQIDLRTPDDQLGQPFRTVDEEKVAAVFQRPSGGPEQVGGGAGVLPAGKGGGAAGGAAGKIGGIGDTDIKASRRKTAGNLPHIDAYTFHAGCQAVAADSRNVTLATLPKSLSDAEKCAADSNFIAQHLPQSLIEFFTK